MPIPNYIAQRIRRPIPLNSCVVPNSTPVISFGDSTKAKIATLGLNPSRIEFLDRNGVELTGKERRLATHGSLGITDIENASIDVVQKVFSDCKNYFSRNPYRQWFDQLEHVLNSINASYYKGSACHLDLVQWATNPTWGGLPSRLRNEFIQKDSEFLANQLSKESIKLILVNGSGVINALKQNIDTKISQIDEIAGHGRTVTKIYSGSVLNKVKVIGWSTNIQSSWGVRTTLREELAQRVLAIEKSL